MKFSQQLSFTVQKEDSLLLDNRVKYHRYSIFEAVPDLKDHLFKYTIEKITEKTSLFNIDQLSEEAELYLN